MLLTVHDPLPHSSEDTWLNRFHRKTAMRLINHFILLNHHQRDAFVNHYGLRQEQVFESRLSIYTHLLQTPAQLPNDAPGYVLFIGSINTHKGVDYLCHAMQLVHKQHPDARLVVAGSGHLYFDITPYTEQGFVKLYNRYLSDAELAGFIRQAAFVVCPYIDATQSGVIMSSFALDKPVIATNVGGLPEMVEHGRHGLIVPPRDADALANAISHLLSQPLLTKQMSDYIHTDYREGSFSWKAIARDFTNIYSAI